MRLRPCWSHELNVLTGNAWWPPQWDALRSQFKLTWKENFSEIGYQLEELLPGWRKWAGEVAINARWAPSLPYSCTICVRAKKGYPQDRGFVGTNAFGRYLWGCLRCRHGVERPWTGGRPAQCLGAAGESGPGPPKQQPYATVSNPRNP